eukprot:TRINITY_DN8689_c1_g1_i1.p1 TRINITY_DN8689_c1_g1~~TRINITY_DN8689_c1_g1_i1.p1  ORF type:complete len:551 (-),score=87.62 TRINITY_DN8689_c1_g1_i1:156-1808(-)
MLDSDSAAKILAAVEDLTAKQALQANCFEQLRGDLAAWTQRQDSRLDRHDSMLEKMVRTFGATPGTPLPPVLEPESARFKSVLSVGERRTYRQKCRGSRMPDEPTKKTRVDDAQPRGRIDKCKDCVKSPEFDYLSAVSILANSTWLGIRVSILYLSPGQRQGMTSKSSLAALDWGFAIFFVLELVARIWAYGCKEFFAGLDRGWNLFDFVVVFASSCDLVLELAISTGPTGVGVLRVARTVRILRVVRVFRVVKFFRALKIMIDAITITLKTGFWAFVLWLGVTYLAAVAISQSAAEALSPLSNPQEDNFQLWYYFGHLGSTTLTLWMSISGGVSWETPMDQLWKLDGVAWTIFNLYVLFTTFCMVNVITGIFCQNAIEVFEADRDNMIEARLSEKGRLFDTLHDIFNEWDESGDGQVSREQFLKHLNDERIQALLASIDLDARKARELFDALDVQSDGHLDLDEFLHGCITMRGNAKALHIERLLAGMRASQDHMDELENQILHLSAHVSQLGTSLTCLPFSFGAERGCEIESAIDTAAHEQIFSEPAL